jgi:uncharacterized membrane protein YeaQ/YmgE (transglycosylase-associated protein family)
MGSRLLYRPSANFAHWPLSHLFDAFDDGQVMDNLLWFLIIGLVAGWLAGRLTKGGGFGLVGDLIVGVIGALVGGWLLGALGFNLVGRLGALVTATIGAVVLVVLLRWSGKT